MPCNIPGDLDEALAIHRESIVIDGLQYLHPYHGFPHMRRMVDAALKGGVTAIHVTIAFPPYDDLATTVRQLAMWHSFIRSHEDAELILRVEDIREAKGSGKVGFILGLQDATPLEDDINLLPILHLLGVRILQLTYQRANRVGCGCGEKRDRGLTEFGYEVIEEMNRIGMVIDLSHCGPRTTLEAIEISKDPVLVTHSCAKALNPSIRCKADEEVKALAEKGGVIGVLALSQFLKEGWAEHGTTLDDFLDHIDYIANLVGVDYVGIGRDVLEGVKEWDLAWARDIVLARLWGSKYRDRVGPLMKFDNFLAEGLESSSLFPRITKGLLERGYSKQEVKKILGGNFLRVFEKVWKG